MFFDKHTQWAGASINTDGDDMPDCSYSLWALTPRAVQSGLGWIMSQYPDHGWSRAITINDGRLSRNAGVSATTGGGWRNTLPKPPVNKWFHIVATWDHGVQTCVYLNGKKGQCTKAGNGKHSRVKETLIIGGRGPNDGHHNPSVAVARAQVYSGILTQKEVTALSKQGSAYKAPSPPPPTKIVIKLDLRGSDYTGTGDKWNARVGPSATLCEYRSSVYVSSGQIEAIQTFRSSCNAFPSSTKYLTLR